MLADLIQRNRSRRRFHEDSALDMETLRKLVDLARLSASAGNLQPLKFILSWEPERNAEIFRHLRWAGYLRDWPGPEVGQRPSGYILILGDTGISKSFGCDHGIAAQSILLGAVELGLGGCMIGSVDREDLAKSLGIPGNLEILLVIALGKPAEIVKIEQVEPSGDIRYWRDEEGIHHVPKRSLDDLILAI